MSLFSEETKRIIEERFRYTNSKLQAAVTSENCNPAEIRKLLEEDPTMLNRGNIVGYTPLLSAVGHGQSVENVIELLKQGAHVNKAERVEYTPLHAAASRNDQHQYSMLKVLLEYGGHINKRDAQGHTPLYIFLKAMRESYQERSLYLLLSNGADVNALDLKKIGILKVALMNPYVSVNAIKMLLEFGANAQYCEGYSVMTLPVAKLILQYILINRIAIKSTTPVFTKKIPDVKSCENLRYYQLRQLVEHRDRCVKELIAMREEKINESYTLFSYINERCSTGNLNENDLKTSLTSKVLLKFNQYPYCRDLIIASIKERCILKELCNTNIYAWKGISDSSFERRQVRLNGDIIQALSTYLSKNEMINLTLAYTCCENSQQLNFSKSSNSPKHICCISNDYEPPIKHAKI